MVRRHKPRSIRFDGRKTSLRIEPELWRYLLEIAIERKVTLGELVSVLNRFKGEDCSLSSALRVFVAQHYRGEP